MDANRQSGRRKGRRGTRTEDYDVAFQEGVAEGWAFRVPEAFRDTLDIFYLRYVDTEQTKKLREIMPTGPDGKPPTMYRWAWTRGVPPLLNFATGQVFYDPPGAYGLRWDQALLVLRRLVMVIDAVPDDPPEPGKVTFTLRTFCDGCQTSITEHQCSQSEFEGFLRTGKLQG